MLSETTQSSHEHDQGGQAFHPLNHHQFSAFGTNHPTDIALGTSRRLRAHRDAMKATRSASKWRPAGATMSAPQGV